jgi:GNAT superfamily N-acetyltransferase
VLHATAQLLRSLGYRDLAWRAADLALAQAHDTDDDRLLGACQFVPLMSMPTEAYAVIESQARTTYEELQRRAADPAARRGYGALHLSSALAQAQANRADLADSHLAEAREAACDLGDPAPLDALSMSFGPTNVELRSMAIAIELDEYD